jgi:hypothetical protein
LLPQAVAPETEPIYNKFHLDLGNILMQMGPRETLASQ